MNNATETAANAATAMSYATDLAQDVALALVTVFGLVAFVVFGFNSLVQTLYKWDILTENSVWPFGQIIRRSVYNQTRATARVLRAAGLDVPARLAVRDAYLREKIDKASPPRQPTRLERRLLTVLKQCIVPLEEGYYWGTDQQNKYFVDTMGAMRTEGRNQLAEIMHEFLRVLVDNNRLEQFHCMLANKDGSRALADDICGMYPPALGMRVFVCKGKQDKSLIQSSKPAHEKGAHPVDFEGLSAFLSTTGVAQEDGALPLRPIVVDDNCAGGSSVRRIVQRFNWLIQNREYDQFRPVSDVVTLFTIKDDKTEQEFKTANAELHTLLVLDNADLEYLSGCGEDEVMEYFEKYKQGYGVEQIGPMDVSAQSEAQQEAPGAD